MINIKKLISFLLALLLIIPAGVKVIHIHHVNHDDHDCKSCPKYDCNSCDICLFTLSIFTEYEGFNISEPVSYPNHNKTLSYSDISIHQAIRYFNLRAPPS
ncbi:MAG: hypothetical protein LBS54_04985 [Dysgonamonadaceae bacterium]|jgi:hypothetical protein|nr:hypothetical protein [Dysgonamonadaceae bacterium]